MELMRGQEALIQKNISLQDKNWFRTGGIASHYAEPQTDNNVQMLLAYAQQNALPVIILGQGANVLIAEGMIKGLVLRPMLRTISIDHEKGQVRAGAGVLIAELIEYVQAQGFCRFEDFAGIPGTVGGALFINLHYFSRLIAQDLLSARIVHVPSGEILTVDAAWFAFGYNQSRLQQSFYDQLTAQTNPEYLLLDATFMLTPADDLARAFARGRCEEIIRHRNRRYPMARTCGSFFRNFSPDEVASLPGAITAVAYYLDTVGVRRIFTQGPVRVFSGHANMLVTQEGATSDDVIAVARKMQKLVYEQFGLALYPECQLIGFSEYPLLDYTLLSRAAAPGFSRCAPE